MKKDFFDLLWDMMKEDDRIYIIFIDLGYPRYDEFKKEFEDRVINTGASEQTALDIAVGLAYEGKIPYVYTITSFFLRGIETIRTYIVKEKLNVKLIGAGRNDDYSKHDGYSHDARDIGRFMKALGISEFYPKNMRELVFSLEFLKRIKHVQFLNLTR